MRFKILTISMLLAALVSIPVTSVAQDEYWHQRVTLFDKLPVEPRDIVFLGNSITDGGEFNELFGMEHVKNRGIRSDVIGGVEKRLAQVTSGHPAKIFLLIGINDISHGHSVEVLARKYEKLVKAIRTQSPGTMLYLQSVMPINNDFGRYRNLRGKENIIPAFNAEIDRIATENGCLYVDLWGVLADPETGKLRKEMTNDGLHLTGIGYKAWAAAIDSLVKESVVAPMPTPDHTAESEIELPKIFKPE